MIHFVLLWVTQLTIYPMLVGHFYFEYIYWKYLWIFMKMVQLWYVCFTCDRECSVLNAIAMLFSLNILVLFNHFLHRLILDHYIILLFQTKFKMLVNFKVKAWLSLDLILTYLRNVINESIIQNWVFAKIQIFFDENVHILI